MNLFCSSLPPLSNQQKFTTLSSNSDRACLDIKEASLSGKSESLSLSIRDSEGTRLAPRGEQPVVEGSRLKLAWEADLEPKAAFELEMGPVSEDLQASPEY